MRTGLAVCLLIHLPCQPRPKPGTQSEGLNSTINAPAHIHSITPQAKLPPAGPRPAPAPPICFTCAAQAKRVCQLTGPVIPKHTCGFGLCRHLCVTCSAHNKEYREYLQAELTYATRSPVAEYHGRVLFQTCHQTQNMQYRSNRVFTFRFQLPDERRWDISRCRQHTSASTAPSYSNAQPGYGRALDIHTCSKRWREVY
jgi:hypothetical protein